MSNSNKPCQNSSC